MIDLNAIFTVEECAAWLKLSVENLRAKSKGKKPLVPVLRLNSKVIRYSPRMILAKLGENSGMSTELIAASLNEKP